MNLWTKDYNIVKSHPLDDFLPQFSRTVLSDSLRPCGLQHDRLPCPSPTLELAQTHVYQVGDAIQPSHLVKQVQAHYKLDLPIKDQSYSLDASFSLDFLLFLSKQARKVSFSSLGVLLSLSKVAFLVLSHFSLLLIAALTTY